HARVRHALLPPSGRPNRRLLRHAGQAAGAARGRRPLWRGRERRRGRASPGRGARHRGRAARDRIGRARAPACHGRAHRLPSEPRPASRGEGEAMTSGDRHEDGGGEVRAWWSWSLAVSVALAAATWLGGVFHFAPTPLERYLADRAAALDTGAPVT